MYPVTHTLKGAHSLPSFRFPPHLKPLPTYTHTHVRTHTLIHTYTHACTYVRKHTDMHTRACIQERTYIMHVHTQPHTHTHTHNHTHTYTHTHTQSQTCVASQDMGALSALPIPHTSSAIMRGGDQVQRVAHEAHTHNPGSKKLCVCVCACVYSLYMCV